MPIKKFTITKPKEIAKLIMKNYELALDNEKIRVTAGELSAKVYDDIAEDIIAIIHKKNLDVSYLVGPIFHVNKKDIGNRLVKMNFNSTQNDMPIKMYMSPTRQLRHYMVFGERFTTAQNPHDLLSEIKEGYLYHNSLYEDQIQIRKFINHFDSYISRYDLKPLNDYGHTINVEDEEMKVVMRRADSDFIDYNFLTKERINSYLEEIRV